MDASNAIEACADSFHRTASTEGNGEGFGPVDRSLMHCRVVPMFQFIRSWWQRHAATVDHPGIATAIDDDGALKGNYLFMCVMAAGIAMIGLLCNSAAVIIGAMLVSPLMGPIVRLGLGLATLNPGRAFRALGTLLAGMGIALATSILIVWLSPLRTVTPEILARTTPNLFDMIAAVLSGLAGGYAMIRSRGGTIVGVAIATALMPPMTVVGFGIATAQWDVSRGALLLFTTNLAAIALSVTLVSTWYGFGGAATRRAVAWQAIVGFAVLLPLGWPLASALGNIAQQTRLLSDVRSALNSALPEQPVHVLNMQLNDGRPPTLDVTFAVQEFGPDEDLAIRKALAPALPAGTRLQLTPVISADPSKTRVSRSALSAPVASASTAEPLENDETANALVQGFPLPLLGSDIDAQNRRLTLIVSPASTASLVTLHQMESELGRRHGEWQIHIVPPPRPLPPVLFARGSAAIGDTQRQLLEIAQWALSRWNCHEVLIEGRASTDGDGPENLAAQRARNVGNWLDRAGLRVDIGSSYPLPAQDRAEATQGPDAFRSVFIQVTDQAKTD
jgi:uncharacterized hydrophobic protein (TIGR00271 family)